MMTKKFLGSTAVAALVDTTQSLKSTSTGFTSKIETHAAYTTILLKDGYADLEPLVDTIVDQAQVAGIANSKSIKDMIAAQNQVHQAFGNGHTTAPQPHRSTRIGA